MKDTINWNIFKEQLPQRLEIAQYQLRRAIAETAIRQVILEHKSQIAYKAFKRFSREIDRATLTSEQRITMIEQFNVLDHLD